MKPDEDTLDRARVEQREVKDRIGFGLFDGKNPWVGKVGESALECWLRLQGLPVKLNGGVDHLPDLEVGDIAVGAKTRDLLPAYLNDMLLLVPIEQAERPWDWWAFCVYVIEFRLLLIVGAMTPDELHRVGEFTPGLGEKPHPALMVRPGQLVPPAEFAAALSVRLTP